MNMHATKPRDILIRAIEDRLIPTLIEMKFVRHPLPEEDRKSREIRAAFPFGIMKRENGENLELVSIQIDTRVSPKFIINFGAIPPGMISRPWGSWSQQDADVSLSEEPFRLYMSPSWHRWFAPPWFLSATAARIEKTVDEAKTALSEVDVWFTSRIVGKHMRSMHAPILGAKQVRNQIKTN